MDSMELGRENWRSFDRGIEKEWLLANGIGGYASSTVIGANTRRYHGLLVASLNPPVERHLILSKIDECLMIGNETYNLYSFRTPDFTMKGFEYQVAFEYNPLPLFTYNVSDVFITKEITMVYGENTVAVVYHIYNGKRAAVLRLTPLVNFRDYHHNSVKSHMVFSKRKIDRGVVINPYNIYGIDITITCDKADFTPAEDCWFINMYYPHEAERGLPAVEDHYIPGFFDVYLAPGEDKYVTIIATLEKKIKERDGRTLIKNEKERIAYLVNQAGFTDDFARELVIAADKFIVHRKSTRSKTIIAGYPWFTDWGRDTMIALPGIALVTKRFDDARQILYTFSRYERDGLLPNMFPDSDNLPAYNTADASLWFFEAVGKYIEYTGDYEFIKDNIYITMKNIIHAYKNGTRFGIRMDGDCLISAGDAQTQLTWMDAKIGHYPVTSRHGKAVEINALWFNALKVISRLAEKFGEDGTHYEKIAQKVKVNFEKTFWNEEKQCLYDVITDDFRDGSVRPNQILAVSLTNPLIEGEKARKIIEKVLGELYIDCGIRSLSPEEEGYKGVYTGDQYNRDLAYHQGTAWTWLLGQFITAYARVFGRNEKLDMFFKPLRNHFFGDGCLGSVSEIFDGNPPFFPRGCFAQAWSTGEILRAYAENILRAGN